MTKRHKVTAYNPLAVWLLILVVATLIIGVTAIVFVIAPAQQIARQAQATTDALQAEIGQHYAAGQAFAQAGDWPAAADAFRLVIALDAGYRDAQAQLANALANMAAGDATATWDGQRGTANYLVSSAQRFVRRLPHAPTAAPRGRGMGCGGSRRGGCDGGCSAARRARRASRHWLA